MIVARDPFLVPQASRVTQVPGVLESGLSTLRPQACKEDQLWGAGGRAGSVSPGG